MSFIYLAPWEWFDDGEGRKHWRSPGGIAKGCLDIRSKPQIETPPPTPSGFGIFMYDQAQSIRNSVLLGQGLDLPLENKGRLDTILGRTITATLVKDLLWDFLTIYSDPSGQTSVKPIRGRPRTTVKLKFGGSVIKEDSFDSTHLTRTLNVRKEDYIRNRQSGVSLETLKKWTGYDSLKFFGREPNQDDLDMLLPTEFRSDGWERPSTTIGDTFVEATDTNLESHTATGGSGGFSWGLNQGSFNVLEATDVVNFDTGSGFSSFRAESDLSTDDHYAQLEVTAIGTGSAKAWFGPRARFNSANGEGYGGFIYQNDDNLYLARYDSSDTETIITNTAVTLSLPDTVKLEVNGSNMDVYFNGSNDISTTDTNITGNVRTGIASWRFTDSPSVQGDNFEAADLAAGGANPLPGPLGMPLGGPLTGPLG